MERIRRTRPVVEAPRIRRVPRPLSGRADLSIVVRISASVMDGSASEEQLLAEVAAAVERQYMWRMGWIGLGATGHITKPVVALCDEP